MYLHFKFYSDISNVLVCKTIIYPLCHKWQFETQTLRIQGSKHSWENWWGIPQESSYSQLLEGYWMKGSGVRNFVCEKYQNLTVCILFWAYFIYFIYIYLYFCFVFFGGGGYITFILWKNVWSARLWEFFAASLIK